MSGGLLGGLGGGGLLGIGNDAGNLIHTLVKYFPVLIAISAVGVVVAGIHEIKK